MKKAFFFDLDWTLIDNRFYPSIYEYILKRTGVVDITIDELRANFYREFRDHIRSGKYLEAFDWDYLMEKTLKKMGIKPKVRFSDAFKHNYETGKSGLMRGVKKFLEKSKENGYIIGIVTNGLKKYQDISLRWTGLDEIVDFVVTSDEVGIIKPFPAIYKLAELKARKLGAESFAFFGDNLYFDIVGALKYGIEEVYWITDKAKCFENKKLKDFEDDVLDAKEYYGIDMVLDDIWGKEVRVYRDYDCLCKKLFNETC